ncbi:prepilin peptidase [Chengkuizengella sp. SCS-71B]|uniref:prepilin peptidase n=1 Tax=Chengkuizengella sp. SCS-71B TaxID=3115290 RepID=UPI0032C242C8
MIIVFHTLFWSVFLWVAIYDARFKIIPNAVPILLGTIGFFLLGQPISSITGAFLGGGILLLLALCNQQWVGGGDIKIMIGLGFAFGIEVMWILWIACVMALILTLLMRKKSMAFAPFLFLSSSGVQILALFTV